MPAEHKEIAFEAAIEHYLTTIGGYVTVVSNMLLQECRIAKISTAVTGKIDVREEVA